MTTPPEGIEGLSRQQKRDLLEKLLRQPGPGQRVPLSEAQLRLWELEAHLAPQAIHCFALAYTLRGPLDAALLERALQAVAARHPALRMHIARAGDRPCFEVAPPDGVHLEQRTCPRDAAAREELLRQLAARTFDLMAGPAWRAVLLRAAGDEHVLLLQFHHIAADRWSAAVLVQNLGAAYAALAAGEPLPPPAEPAAPPPAVDWRQDPEAAAQLPYWKRLFSGGAQTLELPSTHTGHTFHGYSGDRLEGQLDPAALEALKGLAAAQSTTLFSVLLAAFALLLESHTAQTDLLICTPMTGRHRAGTRGVIGYFNNIIPLRLDLRGNPAFTELAGRVAAQALEAYAHQDVPFQVIAELPEAAGLRLTRCLFALQNIPGLHLTLPGIRAAYRDVPNGAANFDLSVFLEEKDGRLLALFDYKSSVIDHSLAEQLRDRYLGLLRRVAAQPAARLEEFPRYRQAAPPVAEPEPAAKAAAAAVEVDPAAEETMLRIWRELFAHTGEPVGPGSHFFEMGGDSLRAARLFARIEQEFGRQLPLATLFEAPTPRTLAERIADQNWVEPWESLLPVRTTGTRPPLFCVAGGGGNVVAYRKVADCLDPDQPVYCLQAKGLRRGDHPFATVEEMAEYYLEAVRRLHPHGPYLFTGHSFGALVAYEMAQRVTQQGGQVPLLALLDYPGPDVNLTNMDWMRFHLISLSMLSPRERWNYIKRGISWRLRTTRTLLRIRRSEKKAAEGGQPAAWSSASVLEQSMRAIRAYRIQPYNGRVTLIRGRHANPRMVVDPQGGWGRVALQGVEVHEIPGTHISIFREPHIRELGATLGRCLDKLFAKDGPGADKLAR